MIDYELVIRSTFKKFNKNKLNFPFIIHSAMLADSTLVYSKLCEAIINGVESGWLSHNKETSVVTINN